MAQVPTASLLLTRDLSNLGQPPVWPAGVRLVPLSITNAIDVHALMQRAYAEGGGGVPADALSWWVLTSTDDEYDTGLAYLVADHSGPVALCLCWSSGFVKDLVVDPAWQGRGLGASLLSHAMHDLRQRGHHTVSLKVLTANVGARRFYERMGFRPAE